MTRSREHIARLARTLAVQMVHEMVDLSTSIFAQSEFDSNPLVSVCKSGIVAGW